MEERDMRFLGHVHYVKASANYVPLYCLAFPALRFSLDAALFLGRPHALLWSIAEITNLA